MYNDYRSSEISPDPQLQPDEAELYQNDSDNDNSYCGFPLDSNTGKPWVDKIEAPIMPWTRYGAIIIALLLFLAMSFITMTGSPYIVAILNLISVDIMICMFARLANAMSEKNMWYPKDYLMAAGISWVVSVLLHSAGAIFGSEGSTFIASLADITAGVLLILSGRDFAKNYSGNLCRFGNALIIFGILAIAGGILDMCGGTTDSIDPKDKEELQYMLGSSYSIIMLFFSAASALAYYAILWPFRIMAKMMSDHDEPTDTEEVMENYAEHKEKKNPYWNWKWFLLYAIIIMLVHIIMKLIFH